MEKDDKQHWALDKKVPIALIVTLALQTGLAVWWSATITTRLDVVERRIEAAAPQAERLIRVEEKVGVVQQSVNDVKIDVKALLQRRP